MRDQARIAIVNDHEMARRGLAAMVSTVEWARVVAEGSDGHAAVAIRFSTDAPDLMIINGLMPGMNGPEAIALIRERERVEGVSAQLIVIESLSGDQRAKGLAAGANAACSPESGAVPDPGRKSRAVGVYPTHH